MISLLLGLVSSVDLCYFLLLCLGFGNGVLVDSLLISGFFLRLVVRNFSLLILNFRLDFDNFFGAEVFHSDHGSILLLDSLNFVDLISSTGGIRSL